MKRGHIPVRQCIACRARRPKRELIRLEAHRGTVVTTGPGEAGRSRGCYLCPTERCIETALTKGRVSRALRGNFKELPSKAEIMRRLEIKGLVNGAVDR
jgi:predicted RNA-binding protein YlxR (DUF448 family)